MDLGAFANIEALESYVTRHYGKVPRIRGIRLMAIEKPEESDGGRQIDVYNGYCGKDVVYIQTRCGSAIWGDEDPDANYISCGGRDWEKSNPDTFLESINDEWDGTYRDHYFKAVIDDEYKAMIESKGVEK